MAMVKCLVCGAVFEAGVKVCPVCGVGPEHFVPLEETSATPQGTNRRFLVLGGGIAAVSAAQAIREQDPSCSIVMLAGESVPPYARPMLTKGLSGSLDESKLMLHPESWYAEQRIFLLTGEEVTAIDPSAREVHCRSGLTMAYDRLIYALGAQCFVPPIPGSNLPHVTAIRSLADARKVRQEAEQAHTAAVIGGGVLGLEAAWAMQQLGLKVTVLEVAPQLMGRQLDTGTSALLAQRLAALGMDVKLGANITQITPEAVLLADGTEIPSEIVLVSAGVRANVQLAQAAGLACGRAVTVDDHMRTSDPDIFACGDCAELNGVNMALWGEAQNQGRTAGTNAAGGDAVCPPESGALVLNALKTTLFSIGDCGKENRTYKVVTRPGKKPDSYARYWFCDGLLRGAILLDDLSSMARITKLMRQNATEEETLA